MFFRIHVFQGSGFPGVLVSQSPSYSESRFFWVQVIQGPGSGFRSSLWTEIESCLSNFTLQNAEYQTLL